MASKKGIPAKPKYVPTEEERRALESFASLSPSMMEVSKEGDSNRLTPTHPDKEVGLALLVKALGTNDIGFLNGLVNQLAQIGSKGAR